MRIKQISNKNNGLICLLILICFAFSGNSQNYSIIKIDDSGYPFVKAYFMANSQEYKKGILDESHLQITHNSKKLPLIDFKPPKQSIIPASFVIILDVSGSMRGNRFNILKKTANDFIEFLPLDVSEVAIATFHNNVNMVCDFTHNELALQNSVNQLQALGGTSFNNAFLNPYTGSISIAKRGKYKRVIIFITDGQSVVEKYNVINKANADSITINCITVGLSMPDDLKNISKETGGNFYSDLNTVNEIKDAFNTIYLESQHNAYGSFIWEAPDGCYSLIKTNIAIDKDKEVVELTVPKSKIGKVTALPPLITFSKPKVGTNQTRPIVLQGLKTSLNVTSALSSKPELFSTSSNDFPILSKSNYPAILNVNYIPKDTIYTTAHIRISNPGCPDVKVHIETEGKKKLIITSPKGGESFPRYSSINISWEGISKTTPVDFYYQHKPSLKWTYINTVNDFATNWEAPNISGQVRIMGQVTNNITLPNLMKSPIAIAHTNTFSQAVYNKLGNEVLIKNNSGELFNWNIWKKELNYKAEHLVNGNITFDPELNRIICSTNQSLNIFTNRNGLLIKRIPVNKRSLAVLPYSDNVDLYTSASETSVWDPTINQSYSINSGKSAIDAAISPKGNYIIVRYNSKIDVYEKNNPKKLYSIKTEKDFKRAILHYSQDILAFDNENSIAIYDLKSRQIELLNETQNYLRFSISGKQLITRDYKNKYIYNLKSNKVITSFPVECPYKLSADGNLLCYNRHDSLYFIDANTGNSVISIYQKQIKDFQLFPSTARLLIQTNDSIKVFNIGIKKMELAVSVTENLIKTIDIAPNEKSLLITTPNVIAEWNLIKHLDTDTTDYFTIFCPSPLVKETLNCGKLFVNTPKEFIFPHVISNPSSYPLIIDSVYFESGNNAFSIVDPLYGKQILPNETSPLEIRFSPKLIDKQEAIFVVASGGSQYKIQVSGFGISKNFELISDLLHFQAIEPFKSSDSIIPLLRNSGTEPFTVNNIEIKQSVSDFEIKNVLSPSTLERNDTLFIKVSFSPKQRGLQSTQITLKIDDNEIDATQILGKGKAKRQLVIAGITFNPISNETIKSQVKLVDLKSSKTLKALTTNNNGRFFIQAKTDFNYNLSAQASGYFSSSVNIDLSKPQQIDTIWVDIELLPIINNSTIKLNNVFFEFGKANLLNTSKPELERLTLLMNQNPEINIEIHGHTDNIGSPESNLTLSKNRCLAIKHYLLAEGIEKRRMNIKWHGESQPIKTNNSEEGRKANRRVEIKIIL